MSKLYNNNFEFIDRLRKGDEKAYAYLVKTYHKPLFIYALSLTHDHAQSEDIVQITFVKTWEFRKRLNADYSIKSFLYKTTYNEFINQYHSKRSLSALEKVYMEALEETIDDDNSELLVKKIKLVTESIKELPAKCKEIFLMSKKEGLTNIEIAEHLNISIKTVEGQITKGYKLLRTSIGVQYKEVLFLLFGMNNRNHTTN